MTFETLGLSSPLCKALEACKYEEPTPIQETAIPAALRGEDVLGIAQTGTGKTCAFGTPIIERLNGGARKRGKRVVRALILTPTRELALQIGANLREYSKEVQIYSTVIFGGVGQANQVERLERGVDILTATPGRLLDLHKQGLLDLSHVEILVLDEADRMLDMGFIGDVKKIIKLLPEKKQTLFFSATMPEEIEDLVNSLMKNPVRVEVTPASSTVDMIEQKLYFIDRTNKMNLLVDILQEDTKHQALIFTRTKHSADKVTRVLVERGIKASAIHGNKSQTARQSALSQFKQGKVQALVATDIAARGIDIDRLPFVFNYNLPDVAETYVHRIGRTGRAGRQGVAITFCDHAEKPLLRNIEQLLGKEIPKVLEHPYPLQVFEGMKRDKNGRLVHPDDEEARQEARLKRSQMKSQASKKQTSTTDKQIAQPNAKATAVKKEQKEVSNRVKTQKDNKVTGPKPRRQNKKSVDEVLKKADNTPARAIPKQRRNPFDGDVIMDATERFFSSSRAATTRVQNTAPKRDNNQMKKQEHFGKQAENKTNKATQKKAQTKSWDDGKQRAKKVDKPMKKSEMKSQESKRVTPQSDKKQETKSSMDRSRRFRRPPQVEGIRSKQKDSTEQPSLMKPFYINND